MFRNFILLFSIFCFVACEKKEDMPDPPPPSFDAALTLDKITGLNLSDENGSLIGSVGNPNIRTGNIAPYPNPAQSVLSVFSLTAIAEIYFLKAEQDTAFSDRDFGALLTSHPFDLDSIRLQKYQHIDMLGTGTNLNLNVENFDAGYYRMFFSMPNDSIYCENIYIDPNSNVLDMRTKIFDDWK